MTRRAALVLGAMMATQINVVDAGPPTMAEQAVRCWNIPPVVGAKTFWAVFDVVTDPDGSVIDISVVDFEHGSQAERLVRSASRAIETCDPYRTDSSSTRVEMRAAPVSPIDPFKDRRAAD